MLIYRTETDVSFRSISIFIITSPVLQIESHIAPATTTTYGDIAIDLGRESAQRAVGAAVGKNPVSILIPCHRVIGKNQKLTGFAGGLCNKEWLLRHELDLLAGHIDKTGQRVEVAVTNNG